MAGPKGNVLTNWIREFTLIVMVQTIQAFLFAIIMVLIVKSGHAYVNDSDESSENAGMAMGIVGIVGLASIAKLEDLVKKMLGTGPSVTDPSLRGGMKSFATGMLAARMAGRVTNNLGNITGGVRKVASSPKQEKAYLQKRQNVMQLKTGISGSETPEQLEALGKGTGFPIAGAAAAGAIAGAASGRKGAPPVAAGSTVPLGVNNLDHLSDEDKKRAKALLDERQDLLGAQPSSVDPNTLLNGSKVLGTPAGQKEARLNEIDNQLKGLGALPNVNMPTGGGADMGAVAAGIGPSAADLKQMSRSDLIATQNLLDGYDEKLAEIKKQKTEGIQDIVKGFTGTAGALAGGITGAAVGAALGEMDDVVKAAGAGIGVGDFIGEKAVDLPTGAADMVKKSMSGMATKNELKQLRKQFQNQTNTVQKIIKNQRDNIDASNVKF